MAKQSNMHKRIPSDLEGLTRMFSNGDDIEGTENMGIPADQALF